TLSISLSIILLKTQPHAIINEIPTMVANNNLILILPLAARKKPPANVIILPKIIPGFNNE
ncbi:MAG: hypothetical protein RL017_561, partial [Pseudomonadota bacterium]